MLEVSVVEGQEPFDNFFKGILLALVVRVLASSDAFFVELHQLGSSIWKQMFPYVFLLLMEQGLLIKLAARILTWERLIAAKATTHW